MIRYIVPSLVSRKVSINERTTDEETDSWTVNIMPLLPAVGGGEIQIRSHAERLPNWTASNNLQEWSLSLELLSRKSGTSRFCLKLKTECLNPVLILFQSGPQHLVLQAHFQRQKFIEVSNKLHAHSNVCLWRSTRSLDNIHYVVLSWNLDLHSPRRM